MSLKQFNFRSLLLSVVIWLPIISFTTCTAQSKGDSTYVAIHEDDGPYIFNRNSESCNAICVNKSGIAVDSLFYTQDAEISFNVCTKSKNHKFSVTLKGDLDYTSDPVRVERNGKIYVFSDPHGNFDFVAKNLKEQGIIDDNFNWSYGNNQLVVIGDVFDRGEDVLPILWLIYKLEFQAKEVGGGVYYTLGNHEIMVLENDLRYVNKKYLKVASSMKMDYHSFFNPTAELYRWIASKNTIQIVGEYLFVHAGLSTTLENSGLSLDEINNLIRSGLSLSKTQKRADPTLKLLFTTQGPIWYRGMVVEEEKYDYIDEKIVDKMLEKYSVKNILIGHTEFDTLQKFFSGKVIAVNVDADQLQSAGVVLE